MLIGSHVIQFVPVLHIDIIYDILWQNETAIRMKSANTENGIPRNMVVVLNGFCFEWYNEMDIQME